MKTKNLLIVGIFTLTILALGTSCEVYEIVNTVDTIFVDRPVNSLAPSFITVRDTIVVRDTVSTTVFIRDTIVNNIHTTDTIFQVVTKDSVIVRVVEKVVNHTDTVVVTVHDTIYQDVHHYDTIVKNVIKHDTITLTVYDRTVIYLDTAVIVSYMRPTYSVPDDIQPFIEEFYTLANQYGLTTEGNGVIIVQYVTELPGENWSSNSWTVSENSQNIIELDQRYPAALHRAGIFREMSRLFLNKKYVTDVNKIMSPLFDPQTIITKQHLDILFK